MEQQRSERVDVGAPIDRGAARLLGRHVRGGADDRAELGLVVGAAGRAIRAVVDRGIGDRHVLGESPVDHDRLAEVPDEHVLRLEVAMDHALAMRVRDRVGDRECVGHESEAPIERRGLGDHPVE